MPFLVLDSGGVSALTERTRPAATQLRRYQRVGSWPALVPAPVLVECLTGHSGKDARTNLLLKSCKILDRVPVPIARRAAGLRTAAGRGSAVDALVVAFAELHQATVLTSDPSDLGALAEHADGVLIETTW
jgi:predicted nucleic acid-binding protein